MQIDELLIKSFINVLDTTAPAGRQKEQVVQEFLEQNTELIPTPNRLNHHLHFQSIVSKFPLGTELTTDYVYITKSSDVWIVTFVELESPDKDIYTSNIKQPTVTAAFNASLDQVRSWKTYLGDNAKEVIRRLEPLLQPTQMRSNPVEYHFQLIIGRSKNKNLSEGRKRHFRLLQNETGIQILTYDQLVDWYRNDQRYKKNVLRLRGVQYEFKSMAAGLNHMLSYLSPGQLLLSENEDIALAAEGFDMDAWRSGELLVVNGKYPMAQCGALFSNLLNQGRVKDA